MSDIRKQDAAEREIIIAYRYNSKTSGKSSERKRKFSSTRKYEVDYPRDKFWVTELPDLRRWIYRTPLQGAPNDGYKISYSPDFTNLEQHNSSLCQDPRGADTDAKVPFTEISQSKQRKRIKTERWIPGHLKGIPVSALPDNCSDHDILSEAFVIRNGFSIDTSFQRLMKLPNGNVITSVGTVTLPFSFDGETESYNRVFTVLPRSVHDVILGNKFLSATSTLTDPRRRIKKKYVSCDKVARRLNLLDSPMTRVLSSINGVCVSAYPDTGSDVMVISKEFAKRLGLEIFTGKTNKTWLEFVDGSYAETYGMVFDVRWHFGLPYEQMKPFQCDFHVLEGLSCPVILSADALFGNKAFLVYKNHFYNDVFSGGDLCLIREKQNCCIRRLFSYQQGQNAPPIPARTPYADLEDEVVRRGREADRIAQLPESQQANAREMERRRIEQFDRPASTG